MKALVGSWADRPYRLQADNAALRARVAELTAELHRVGEELEVLRAALARHESIRVVDEVRIEDGDREVALSSS